MVRGCGNKCMKYTLFLFNLAFLLIGLALLIMGVFVLLKKKDFQDVLETPDAAAILIVIVGVCVTVISFFGCCGAIQEGRCMLFTYALVVGLAMILEIVAAVLLLVYMGSVTDDAARGFENAMRKYKPQDNKDMITSVVDNIQWSLKCCGGRDPQDWGRWQPLAFGTQLPSSCCYDPNEGGSRPCSVNQSFRTGCQYELDRVLKFIIWFLSGILIAAALTQMLAACFACSVAKAAD